MTSPPAVPRRSPLDTALQLFAEVRPGEGLIAVLMLANVFLILASYYVLKTVREGLILTGGMMGLGGDELKIYASAAMAVLLVGVVPAYGWLGSRVRRIRLINASYALVLGSLAIFFVLGRAGAPVGLAFFLWLGIVNMFLVGQFWSYANDVYDEEQGKRLFAIIALGASLGAIVGPKLAGLADTYTMMAVAAGIFLVCLGLFNLIERLLGQRPGRSTASDQPLGKTGGFQLVLSDRYILLIAVVLLLANQVNTVGEFILSNTARTYAAHAIPDGAHADLLGAARDAAITADRRELTNAFYGDFYFWVNLVGFLVQAFLVSRLLQYAGVRVALFVLPLIALGGYGAIGLVGGVAVVRFAKIAENSVDYSVQNTVRHALWLPTSREAKYKAKAAVDTFFVRFGDALAAILVWVGLHQLGLGPRSFAFVNLGLIALWIIAALFLVRRHRQLSIA